jgi:predicted phosphodiesterase
LSPSSTEDAALCTRKTKSERIFVVSDLHTPYHDPRAVALAKQLFDAFRPSLTVFIGDNRDFIWASRFFVPHREREGAVIRELRAWESVSKLFSAPTTKHLRGNHEARLLQYLDEHPELVGLEGFTPSTLYPGLVKNDFFSVANGSFIFTHGSIVRSGPGASAAAEMQKWGRSGCTGHTHRLSEYYKRDYSGIRVWLECGCLALNPPHYRKVNNPAPENWHQGIVVVETEGNGFEARTIPFTLSYTARLHGIKYRA